MAQGTDFKGKSVENTYQNILAIDNPSFNGADSTLRHLQDTRGTRLPIQVEKVQGDGSAIVNITGTFKLDGSEINITQAQLDTIDALTAGAYIEVDGGTF